MKSIINNIVVNYIEKGTRSTSPPIIFIHAFPFNHRMWEFQISELSNAIHVISYDIRGFGLSDVGDGQYSIELFVDDLLALMDYLKIDKSILCGLSMGGYIALRTYERNPSKIAGLILCDTKAEADTNEVKIKRFENIITIKEVGLNIFTDNFIKSAFWEQTFIINPSIIENAKRIILENSLIGICGALLALAARTDTTSVLTKIDIPTCIICGKYDRLTPPESAKKIKSLINKSELHIIEDSAHISNLENKIAYNQILLDFFKKHW